MYLKVGGRVELGCITSYDLKQHDVTKSNATIAPRVSCRGTGSLSPTGCAARAGPHARCSRVHRRSQPACSPPPHDTLHARNAAACNTAPSTHCGSRLVRKHRGVTARAQQQRRSHTPDHVGARASSDTATGPEEAAPCTRLARDAACCVARRRAANAWPAGPLTRAWHPYAPWQVRLRHPCAVPR